MGLSFHKTIFLFASMLIFDGRFIGRTVEAVALKDVCRMTYDEHFCLTDFGLNMETAPIHALANLAIADVIGNMNMTRINIEFLLYFSVDPQDRDILTQCKNFYAPVFSSFVASAYYDLKNGQYRQLGQRAAQASRAAYQCQRVYAAHFLKARFESYMYKLKRLSNILEVIAYEFL